MDLIYISALSTMTHIGIHAWEQKIKQQLLFDIQIPIDLTKCNGQLINTIDYAKLCEYITTFVESNAFSLIETVAEKVAELIKKEFNVMQLTLSVSKPRAIKNAGNVSVTITR